MEKRHVLQMFKGGLIVSCQALEDEPLHGSKTMAKMAKAATEGGARAIRANGKRDILAIKQETALPVIGLVKRDYSDSEVYITPTKTEVDELLEANADMIALDATKRDRPGHTPLDTLLEYIHKQQVPAMADVSTLDEGIAAAELGFDCISTTLSGYTPYSRTNDTPDFELLDALVQRLNVPVIAEGRISTPEQAQKALQLGAYAVVVGSAITRPQIITKKYVDYIQHLSKT
ncbi:N-acetylmannosamine-6-phosphate 2-epimerase [Caldalkalibacillus salinus]|uniref:N-acetylmannosamine-6-phosphate 2-epimerase n=1 Tax=Caldalkalibacillus salinus TaxID=2803787 RepID=UPI001923271D|nr:N-acetylmannosamine-6-phosphate 2-epimerase [Caldalkalibacillus salinus]